MACDPCVAPILDPVKEQRLAPPGRHLVEGGPHRFVFLPRSHDSVWERCRIRNVQNFVEGGDNAVAPGKARGVDGKVADDGAQKLARTHKWRAPLPTPLFAFPVSEQETHDRILNEIGGSVPVAQLCCGQSIQLAVVTPQELVE